MIKQLMTKKATLQSSETDELLDFDLSSLLEVIGSYIYTGATLEQIDKDVYEKLVADWGSNEFTFGDSEDDSGIAGCYYEEEEQEEQEEEQDNEEAKDEAKDEGEEEEGKDDEDNVGDAAREA